MSDLKEYNYSDETRQGFVYATIKTSKGNIKIKLFGDDAPNTVANFAHLSNDGFYNDLKFHRVIDGFMAQGGCPDGTGTGGPDWSIACELENNTKTHTRGTLSMAHAGRDTGGSQFFICFGDTPHLDGEHTVFGCIEDNDDESFNVLDSIEQSDDILSIVISDN